MNIAFAALITKYAVGKFFSNDATHSRSFFFKALHVHMAERACAASGFDVARCGQIALQHCEPKRLCGLLLLFVAAQQSIVVIIGIGIGIATKKKKREKEKLLSTINKEHHHQ